MEEIILQKRERNSLSYDVRKVMDALALDKKQPPKIVGSFQYIVHEYPGDIDMIEEYKSCCNVTQSVNDMAKKFQKVAKKIKNLKSTYFGDFKAGIDMRFFVETGEFDENMMLRGYNSVRITTRLTQMRNQNLISVERLQSLKKLVLDKPSWKQHQEMVSSLKELFIIRWTLDELEKGQKILTNGEKITLAHALTHQSVVKIDVYSFIQGRFLEITNFFVLGSIDKAGRLTVLSKNQAGEDYIKNLKRDLAVYSQPALKKNMKFAKRLWLKGVHDKNYELLKRLFPLFGSGSAKLSQVLSDIETMQLMISKLKNPPIHAMIRSLQDIKMRMATVSATIIPAKTTRMIFDRIDKLSTPFSTPFPTSPSTVTETFLSAVTESRDKVSNTELYKQLEYMYNTINNVVNKSTIAYFKKHKIIHKQ